MTITVLSYNVLYSKALKDIGGILNSVKPDIVCLQELETNDDNLTALRPYGYSLADYSNSFIKFGRVFGQATFYNKKKLSFTSSSVFDIPRSYYEVVLRILRGVNEPRTVLKTEFKKEKTAFTVYNLHLTAHQATNKARTRQLEKTLGDLQFEAQDHVIITGDFNYSYGRKKFEQIIAKYNLKEATNNLYYTSIFRFLKIIPFKFKADYILYRGLKLKKTERVNLFFSDHFPIISIFTI